MMAQYQKSHVAMSLIHSSLVQRSHRAVGEAYKTRAAVGVRNLLPSGLLGVTA